MTEHTLTPAQAVERAGVALYGDRWQSALAEELQINPRTVQRIAKAAREGEEYRSARTILADLRARLVAKRDEFGPIIAALDALIENRGG